MHLTCGYFNPRPPCGGRRIKHCLIPAPARFQSTPPVRGATLLKWGLRHRPCISIHAPRAGGDRCCKAIAHKKPYFNPRPPCGGRLPFFVFVFLIMKFQSTPPVRGATSIRGGRKVACEISIHAPRAGGDCRGLVNASDFKTFQSTPPVRGATLRLALRCGGDRISIHAPRAGGDSSAPARCFCRTDFNPRPPCGGRRGWCRRSQP